MSKDRATYRRLYNTARWQRLRARVLTRDNYICQWPGCGVVLAGRVNTPKAPVVHHIEDHRGNKVLFYDPDNLMAVCKACHDRQAQSTGYTGFIRGHDEDGQPLDPDHPWNTPPVIFKTTPRTPQTCGPSTFSPKPDF